MSTLPIAYNNCRCNCHFIPGVLHCVPCCLPKKQMAMQLERYLLCINCHWNNMDGNCDHENSFIKRRKDDNVLRRSTHEMRAITLACGRDAKLFKLGKFK